MNFIPGKTQIHVSGQQISDEDVLGLMQVALSRWYTESTKCAAFGRALSSQSDNKHCTLTNSGSSADLVAIHALTNINTRKFVITCSTGFPTTVSPIYQSGRIPIYVDINPETLEPNYDEIRIACNKFGEWIAGAVLTHTMGLPYKEQIVRDHILWKDHFLISDCCDALGSKLDDSNAIGQYSDASTYSFFPAHHITSIEGGAVLTNRDDVHELTDSLVNWGRSCYCSPGQSNTCGKRFEWPEHGDLPEGYDHKYIFDRLGYNLKMDEFRASLGLSQLYRLGDFKFARRTNYAYLMEYLSSIPEIRVIILPEGASPFGFPIYERTGRAKQLIEHLEKNKITTRRIFAGNLIRQPAFKDLNFTRIGDLKGSDDVMNNMFWVGCHPYLTHDMLDFMIETVTAFYEGEK